jgi:holliday junction DNA helicase RuvA
MISFLKGTIHSKGQNYAILRIGDVGYQIFVGVTLYAELEIGTTAEIYTHQYVREDALDLFGFRSMEELEMFELLLSISGIGPKSALGVLSVASVREIKESIAHGDSGLLTKVSGIGKKTAERVILELRDKVGHMAIDLRDVKGGGGFSSGDEIDALISLGYSVSDARDALSRIDPAITESGARIKAALKLLGR